MLKRQIFFFNRVRRLTEVVNQRCSSKKVFLKVLQNYQVNTTCVRVSFLIKLQAPVAYNTSGGCFLIDHEKGNLLIKLQRFSKMTLNGCFSEQNNSCIYKTFFFLLIYLKTEKPSTWIFCLIVLFKIKDCTF